MEAFRTALGSQAAFGTTFRITDDFRKAVTSFLTLSQGCLLKLKSIEVVLDEF
jgi:hypothetical protein